MTGEITIKIPYPHHLMSDLGSSGIAGVAHQWQCLLCDQHAPTADELVKLRCFGPRILNIRALEE